MMQVPSEVKLDPEDLLFDPDEVTLDVDGEPPTLSGDARDAPRRAPRSLALRLTLGVLAVAWALTPAWLATGAASEASDRPTAAAQPGLQPRPVEPPSAPSLDVLRDRTVLYPSHASVRVAYRDALLAQGRRADGFEEAMVVVRLAPSPEAFAVAVAVAVDLARDADPNALWLDRAEASVDRFGRAFPGDPMAEVWLEEVVHLLQSRGRPARAEALAAEHLCEE